MPDTNGRIYTQTVFNGGKILPPGMQYPFGFSVERPVIVHRLGSLDAKLGAAVLRRDRPTQSSVQAAQPKLD
jgi:hypothetical protein